MKSGDMVRAPKQDLLFVKSGDLVRESRQHNAIGIVTEIFGDLDPKDPWVRVLFSSPVRTYRWCKMSSLTEASKEEGP
jgi:hypothetical protein